MPKVIVPFSEKGGVGKTTTNLQLAYNLGRMGNTILVADLDSSSAATGHLTGRADHALGAWDVLTSDGKVGIADATVEATKDWPGVYVLPSDRQLLDLEVKLSRTPDRDRVLKEAIRKTRSFFDYILIDTPPRLGIEINNALYAATHYITIVDLSEYGSNSAHYSNELAHIVKKRGNKKLIHIGMLLNNFSTGHARVVKEIIRELEVDKNFLSGHIVPASSSVIAAQRAHKSLASISPRGKTTLAFKKLSEQIQEI